MEQNLEAAIKALSGFGSDQMADVGIVAFFFVMVISLVCSIFIAYLYRYFYSGRSTGSEIYRSFPLLGISITSIFISIQFSLPLSLGLLGALSIVRFRTPIKEPEEIGFIMLVIATSISCATFNFIFLGIILIVSLIALLFVRTGALYQRQDEGVIIITLPQAQHAEAYPKLITCLENSTIRGRLESVVKTEEESVISYAFKDLKNQNLDVFQSELDQIIDSPNYSIYTNHVQII